MIAQDGENVNRGGADRGVGAEKYRYRGAVSVDISEVSYCYINNLPISLECLYRILGIWHHQSLLLILVLLKFVD